MLAIMATVVGLTQITLTLNYVKLHYVKIGRPLKTHCLVQESW